MTLTSAALLRFFGKYDALDRIGTTGLATVYRAKDSQGNLVALKVLLGYFAQEPVLLERFLLAMAKVQTLHHPNIANVLHIEHDDSGACVVMEYVPWPTLKARNSPTLPMSEVLRILHQVAAALDYAHQQGIVHRDLRPSNVFYNPETGQVKVSDFGTITLVDGGYPLVRTTVNTPHPSYAPPEQTQGQPPDPRNDVYSLGALAYELLTGEIPYDALNPYTILSRQLATNPTPPSRIEETLPPEVDEVVLKALHRHSDRRYASCTAFVQALEQALSQMAPPPTYAGSTQATLAPTLPAPAQQPDIEGARVMCPHCGAGNPAAAQRCQNCWMTLGRQPVLTKEEETQWTRRYIERLRRHNRAVKLATLGVVFGLLALWAFAVIEIRPPLPKPTTTISSASPPGQWTMAGWNALHTSAVPGPVFVPEGKTLWKFTSQGPILAAPAVDAQQVYVATSDGRVVALDRASGAEAWSFHVNGPVNTTPARAGDLLYFGQRDGTIFALDPRTGKEQWHYTTGGAMYASFTVVDGTLYTGSADNHVYALDANTGKLRWRREVGNWVISAPAVVDGIVLVGSQDGEVYLLDASNGTLRNQVNLGTAIDNSPVVVGDMAYFTTRAGRVIGLKYHQKDIPFQKAVWTIWFNLYIWNMAPPPSDPPGLIWGATLKNVLVLADMATDGQRLFVATFDGALYAFDVNTGHQLWKKSSLGKLRATPIVSGDTVILAADPGQVVGYDAATGDERWRYDLSEGFMAAPALAGDTLYTPTDQGSLYAIQ
ncbi:MAG: PQQ-binding-like beta-propeller repeat protein [Chloroflexi bacterium]|nr:PQQ-binding-like beta-propeller repeat protein [Chloroflexota bacterium]